MIKSLYLKTALPIIAVSVALFGVHLALITYKLPAIYGESQFWLIYVFMVPMTLGALFIIVKKSKNSPVAVGKGFFIYMSVKMILIMLFLSPWLFFKDESTRPMVYQFFLVFFPLLFTETYVLIKLVNLPEIQEKKIK
ncbi:MAG: hypothetical protein ACI865_003157 [Flavobacteriaceae bacterium]|jgi:hypothetical protein